MEEVQKFLKENQHCLKSTQKKVSLPVLNRIYNKLQKGRFGIIQVENDIIIDRHHRYICYGLLNIEINKVNLNQNNSIEIIDWKNVEIELINWDHPFRKYNQNDFKLKE